MTTLGRVAEAAVTGVEVDANTPPNTTFVSTTGNCVTPSVGGTGTLMCTVGAMGAGSHYGTDDARFNDLYKFLEEQRVRLSIRRGVLRFSLHLYNNMDDVARVHELTRTFLKK